MKACPQQDFYSRVHSIVIHNSEKLQSVKLSITRWSNKQMLHLYHSLIWKKQITDTPNKADESEP